MELDASLSWPALVLTPGLACRLSARLLRKFGSPDRIFHASLTELEGCSLPALVAQAIVNKDAFKRADKELAAIRNIAACRLINWTEPEYPQTLLQIYDSPVLFYLRGDPQILNLPCLSIVGTPGRRCTARKWRNVWAAIWPRGAWRFSAAWRGG
jgi:DNA processing protein